jgi:hypothetical protein
MAQKKFSMAIFADEDFCGHPAGTRDVANIVTNNFRTTSRNKVRTASLRT